MRALAGFAHGGGHVVEQLLWEEALQGLVIGLVKPEALKDLVIIVDLERRTEAELNLKGGGGGGGALVYMLHAVP